MSERRTVYSWSIEADLRGQQIIWLKERLAACEAAILDLTVLMEETRSAIEATEREKQLVTDLLCEKYQQQGAINAALY